MLDFWYSERCTRQIKLIICISTCVVIYLSAKPAELSIWFVGFALLIGISLHLTRECILKIKSQNPNMKASQWLIIIPIIALIFLLFCLPKTNQFSLALQSIGFAALGFFIVTLYENRAQR
ncbi:MAG: hypothetical protein KAY41_00390 [Acinetobacter sp.]|nr:hypothetical protein [Acinetobacter sp.]